MQASPVTFLGQLFEPLSGTDSEGVGTSTITKASGESTDADMIGCLAVNARRGPACERRTATDHNSVTLGTSTQTRTRGESPDNDPLVEGFGLWVGSLL